MNESSRPLNEPYDPAAEKTLFEELSSFVANATSYGLFPVAAWGLDFARPDQIALATSAITDLPLALELIEKMHNEAPSPGRFIPIGKLSYIAKHNATLVFREDRIEGLDANNSRHRRLITRLMNYCSAARWLNRAFVLVDMVEFSQMTTPEQLSCRMSLGLTIDQCIRTVGHLAKREVVEIKGFNRVSTGDGFYIWSYDGSSEGHVSLFLLMLLVMAQTEIMHARNRNPLRLKAAFAIGEAYTFPYEGPGALPDNIQDTQFMPDAIGPVLNLLRRLLEVAVPSQVLVAPFEEPGRSARAGETLNINTMLTRIRSEILPQELKPTDSIKAQDIVLDSTPKHSFRVTDKHNEVHYCYNISGRIPAYEKDGFSIQNIGLHPDDAPEIKAVRFRTQDAV